MKEAWVLLSSMGENQVEEQLKYIKKEKEDWLYKFWETESEAIMNMTPGEGLAFRKKRRSSTMVIRRLKEGVNMNSSNFVQLGVGVFFNRILWAFINFLTSSILHPVNVLRQREFGGITPSSFLFMNTCRLWIKVLGFSYLNHEFWLKVSH